MNASSFITFFTYILRQNAIPFWKELFVALKMAPNIKENSLYVSSYRRLYKSHFCILKFFRSKLPYTFDTCADIVSYLCKFGTKWHQILYASLRYIHVRCLQRNIYIILFQSRVKRCVCDVIIFMKNVILSYLLAMQ